MINVNNPLFTTEQVRDFLALSEVQHQLRPVTQIEARALGLYVFYNDQDLEGAQIVEFYCERGHGVVIGIPSGAHVQLVGPDGSCAHVKVHSRADLDRPSPRYYQTAGTRPGGFRTVRQVTEDCLDDTEFTAVDRIGEGYISEVEADQWYTKDGYLKLSVSGKYPPETLARALIAAHKELRHEADQIEGGADPAVSRA